MNNNIKKISVLLVIGIVMQSCSIVGLVQSHKSVTGDYVVELKPENSVGYYDMSINVIQGIAAFENGWFTSQTSAGKFMLINYLNDKGESQFNIRFNMDSHGQDLSLEQIEDNKLHLYTTIGHYDEDGASGMVRLIVTLPVKVDGKREMSNMTIEVDKEYNLKLRNSTPTLSEDKQKFAIRSGSTIVVGNKNDILNENIQNATIFEIDKTQLVGSQNEALWFQGIAMKDDLVYCITGNNSLGSSKQIFVYNLKGEVVKKHIIENSKLIGQLTEKHEPEGITFVGDQLYYTIMVKGKTGQNRKFLYKIGV